MSLKTYYRVIWVLANLIFSIQANSWELSKGFSWNEVAQVPNARQMTRAMDGSIIIGTRNDGRVFRLSINGRNNLTTIARGLNMPSGVAISSFGDLYIAAVDKIYRVSEKQITKRRSTDPLDVFYDKLPTEGHHGWKNIAFGPDHRLYIPVGVPCNICLSADPIFGTISALNLSNKQLTTIAYGVRNSVGFDWHPITKQLWFSDNGRDWLGDELPPDEINIVNVEGQHFGFPFYHGNQVKEQDSKIQRQRNKKIKYYPPVIEIPAHSAPLGIHFYKGEQFPSRYKGALFVAEHGSWNRSSPSGYRISVYWLDRNNQVVNKEIIVSGFINKQDKKIARPVAFLEGSDGSLLVSDDYGGKIWRLSYK